MVFSKRLALIESLVPAGSRVCDVGTDHGYLPVFLYRSGKCKSISATDINKKPLENARRNIEAAGAADVRLYLCDGLEGITRDMADTVIIAGIGGEVISGIIFRAAFLRDNTVTLILQPTTSADKLRDFLGVEGFSVDLETAVCDNGKLYAVMRARYSGAPYKIDGVRRAIGLIKPDTAEGLAYIKKQYSVIKKRAEDLEKTDKNNELYLYSRDTAAKLEKLLNGEA
ncbi:MAG: SAM-dependent methyltransferase [Clostridia bacterium]|nr:SAM-dependent methyltransferase [Clostridia bacterium]